MQDAPSGADKTEFVVDNDTAEQQHSRDIALQRRVLFVSPDALLQRPQQRVQHAAVEVVGPDQHPSDEVRI